MIIEHYVIICIWLLGSLMYILDLNWRPTIEDKLLSLFWPIMLIATIFVGTYRYTRKVRSNGKR